LILQQTALLWDKYGLTKYSKMNKQQFKPIIIIEFLNKNRECIFCYRCDFAHARGIIRGPNSPVTRDIHMEEQEDRVIKNEGISRPELIKESIYLGKGQMIHNYLHLENDRSINETREIEGEIEDGGINWKINRLKFSRSTSMRDVIFPDHGMPFTGSSFKYLGSKYEYQIIRDTVHIGRIEKHEHLETMDLEWGQFESVEIVIDRAKKKYESKS
jgi:hypothetical protein